jgi:hypothetical protein
MVVPGESEPDPPIRRRVPSAAEDRLATVVSDISKLATAMGALSVSRHPEEAARREQYWGRSGSGSYATDGGAPEPLHVAESVLGGSTTKRAHELGTPGAITTGVGGYANEPTPSTDPPRQAASRHHA